MKKIQSIPSVNQDITLEEGIVFPCSVRVGDLFFRNRVAGILYRINEGQITGERVEEILFFGIAARLCLKEFVAEKLPKLRIFKAVGIQRALVGLHVLTEPELDPC